MPASMRATLGPGQRLRRNSAARSLAASRIADLAALDDAGAIMMIEDLRSALHETLRVLNEIAD